MTTYPRIVPGVLVAPAPDGYVVEGGPRRDRFGGSLVTEVFPRLLPLLDGTRPAADLAGLLGQPGGQITRILEALEASGAVEFRGAPPGPADDRQPGMEVFLRRSLPGALGDTVWRRLGAAAATVAGTGQLADLIAALLRRSGVGLVDQRPGPDDPPGANPCALTIEVVTGRRAPYATGRNRRPRLPVQVGRPEILVGPLLDVPGGPCGRCGWSGGRGAGPGPAGDDPGTGAGATGVAAGVAAGVAVRYLGGYGTSWAWPGAIRIPADLVPVLVPRRPRPDCPACGRPGIELSARAAAELDRDQAAEPPPRGGELALTPAAGGRPPTVSRRHLAGRHLDPGNPGRELAAGLAPGRVAWPALRWILERAVGISRRGSGPGGATPRLWAPTVGGVGPPHAYVARRLPGGPTAVWHFDRAARDFVELPAPAGARLTGSAGATPAGCTVVLVADVGTCRARLGSFAWRAVRQDAGAVVAQLYWCCRALGWGATVRPGDHGDVIAAALGLDPGREVVAAVIDVTAAGPAGETGSAGLLGGAARRASSVLHRSTMTYRFSPEPLRLRRPERLLRGGLSLAESVWPVPDSGRARARCALYARRVAGLRPGLYDALAADTRGLLASTGPSPVIEEYLGDRCLDPPALAFFYADPVVTLADHGAAGLATLISGCAAAASFARLSATAGGHRCGLFARLPGTMLLDAVAGSPRAYAGLAIGHAAEPGPGIEVIW